METLALQKKNKRDSTLTVRLPENIYTKVKRIAKNLNRSQSEIVELGILLVDKEFQKKFGNKKREKGSK